MSASASNNRSDDYFHYIPTVFLMTAPSLEPPPPTPPYLEGTAIHPIFSLENFTAPLPGNLGRVGFVPLLPYQYELLKPALRLASEFITNSACLSWWVTTCLANVRLDVHTQRQYLPHIASVPVHRERVRQRLNQYAPRVRIQFAPDGLYRKDAYGATYYEEDGDVDLVTLHGDHLRYILGGGFETADESRRLCFLFHIARTLIHELSHVISRVVHGQPEPFHGLNEPDIEMGSSWEQFLFGGKIQPLNGDRKAANGLVWWSWFDDYTADVVLRYQGVYMAWVESLFQDSTWRKVERLGITEIKVRTCGDRARWAVDEYEWEAGLRYGRGFDFIKVV